MYLRPATLKGNPSKLRPHFGANYNNLAVKILLMQAQTIFFRLNSYSLKRLITFFLQI